MAEEYEGDEFLDDDFDEMQAEDIPPARKALRFYQTLAWIVGILLIVLTLIGMPLKYLHHAWDPAIAVKEAGDRLVMVVGIMHGWLYAILLVSVLVLGLRVKWKWTWYLGIALAGTVPFLSFFAERRATRFVRRRFAEVEAKAQAAPR